MFNRLFQKMMSNPQTLELEDSIPAPAVHPDSSPFEELAVSLGVETGGSNNAKQVDWWRVSQKFERLVVKGAELSKLMIAEPSESTESEFTAVQDLQEWGYKQDEFTYPDTAKEWFCDILWLIGLNGEFDENEGPNFCVGHQREDPKAVGGQGCAATEALFCQVINPSDGIIVAYDNYTARAMIEECARCYSVIPKLKHWSDVAYLQWLSKANEKSNLRYVLRHNVLNDVTRFAVTYLMLQGRLVVKEWPGTTYNAGSVEFNALLGSPNGSGVAYLLIQHRKGLGHKTVDKVTIFKEKWDIMLLFHITDVGGDDAERV